MFFMILKGDVLVAIDFEMVNDMNAAIEITKVFFMVRFNSLFKSNILFLSRIATYEVVT